MLRLLFLVVFLFPRLALAGEKSLYDFIWLDPDKKVYVLQNKLFQKKYKVYFDLGYLSNESAKFQNTTGFQGRVGWYLAEEWGIEAIYNHYNSTNNDDFKSVQIVNDQVPFIRRFNNQYGLLLIWSPFYGKINTFNRIYYFDWSFGAGISKVNAESNLKTFENSPTKLILDNETYTGALLKTNVKFHIKENLHLGIGYLSTLYNAPSPKNPKSDKLRTNTDFILSIGFSL